MIESDELKFAGPECERFAALVERQWADDRPLTDEDRSFYVYHKNTCMDCAHFHEMLSMLQGGYEDEAGFSSGVDLRNIVNYKFSRNRRRRYWAAALAASIAVGLAVIIAWALQYKGAPSPAFSLARGSVVLEGRAVDVGEQFSFEKKHADVPMDTLIEIPEKLYIAMAEASQIGHVSQTDDMVRLSIEKGRIAVHLVPGSHLKVAVETAGGVVEVKGTVFIVETGGETDAVSVVRGSVLVKSKKAPQKSTKVLEAGWAYSFKNRKHSPRVAKKADALLDLLGIPEPLPSVTAEPVEVAAELTEAPEPSAEPDEKVNVAAERPAPEALLQAARDCRASKNWRCAVDNYSRVVEYYPGMPDAATAMIPIAQILLENLGRPKEALHYFRRYQKRRPEGGLGQEALYGECRAIRQLGRLEAEKDCLTRYMEKYPNTLYTQMAKSRLMGIMVKD